MSVAALIALAIIPAGLYLAAQSESHRKRQKWQSEGPLPLGHRSSRAHSVQPSQVAEQGPCPGKGCLTVTLLEVVPTEVEAEGPRGEAEAPRGKRGLRLYDPFLAVQMGRNSANFQLSATTCGRFNTAADDVIPIEGASFRFPLPHHHPALLRMFLYGKKHRGKVWEDRMMAIGSIPLHRALWGGADFLHVPLVTRKGIRAGYVRVQLQFEPHLPQPFLAAYEDDASKRGLQVGRTAPIVVFSAGCQPSIAVLEDPKTPDLPAGMAGSSLPHSVR